jgi:hypothetical protein
MPVPLRSDVDAAALRGIARRSKDGPHIDEWRRLTLERFHVALPRAGGDPVWAYQL